MLIYLLKKRVDYEGSDILSVHRTIKGARIAAHKFMDVNYKETSIPDCWYDGVENTISISSRPLRT